MNLKKERLLANYCSPQPPPPPPPRLLRPFGPSDNFICAVSALRRILQLRGYIPSPLHVCVFLTAVRSHRSWSTRTWLRPILSMVGMFGKVLQSQFPYWRRVISGSSSGSPYQNACGRWSSITLTGSIFVLRLTY